VVSVLEWKPISTAPRDGTLILGFHGTRRKFPFISVAAYRPISEWTPAGFYSGWKAPPAGWEGWWIYTRPGDKELMIPEFKEDPITHWMPLPELPK